jgi:hypothetical protein
VLRWLQASAKLVFNVKLLGSDPPLVHGRQAARNWSQGFCGLELPARRGTERRTGERGFEVALCFLLVTASAKGVADRVVPAADLMAIVDEPRLEAAHSFLDPPWVVADAIAPHLADISRRIASSLAFSIQ